MPNDKPPRGLSENQKKKWLKQQAADMQGAAQRGQTRFNNFGGNYTKMTFSDLARIPGFGALGSYELSENRSKYYRTTSTGFTVIMDLSKTYFRVQNASNQYVGTDGTVQRQGETDNDFLGRSHFRTK